MEKQKLEAARTYGHKLLRWLTTRYDWYVTVAVVTPIKFILTAIAAITGRRMTHAIT